MSGLHIPVIDPDADTLTAALAYAAAGWYVGYTDPSYHDPKSPEVMGKGWQTKTSRDPQTIIGWYAGRKQLGVFLHAGRSGAWVADVDHPEHMPDVLVDACSWAPYQSTRPDIPGRGHYLFRQPAGRMLGNGRGALGKAWGEARGRNGVIVVWPTSHPNGGCYRWERIGTVLELPGVVADLLPDSSNPEDTATDAEVKAFVAQHTGAERPELLRAVTDRYTAEVAAGASRHETAVAVTCWAMREAAVGLYPARDAAQAIRDLFVASMAKARHDTDRTLDDTTARSEFNGIAAWAIAQVGAVDLDELRTKVNGRAPDRNDISWANGNGSTPATEPAAPVELAECVATFQRWLHLPDPRIVTATVAVLAANLLPGDPLWLLIVGPPSSAKTETLASAAGLTYVHAAATVTPAALLSGTPPKERAKNARGGLLRQVGDFGILLCKDFTSVLAQNRDTRAEALAALREVYDGSWARPVGSAGGLVLEWSGKCGLVGGCTPSIDRHHAVMGALGERFLLYRVTVEEPGAQARKRLSSRRQETTMRSELAAAVAGVLAMVDCDSDIGTAPDEDEWLVDLAVFTAAARTPVERDGYTREVVVMPESEGPARIATQLGAMRDGLLAIGAPTDERWAILHKLATDAMPAMRRAVLDALAARGDWCTRAGLMDVTDIPGTPLDRELEDLVLIGLADREKAGDATNSPWRYALSERCHELWPSASPKRTGGPDPFDHESSKTNSQSGVSTYRGSTEAAV